MTASPSRRATNHGPNTGTREHRKVNYDEDDFKSRLSDEYKILQDKIDKIGGFRFTIKGWSITAVVAGIATTGGRGFVTSCTVALGLVLMLIFFYFLEHEQVRQSRLFGDRARRIEDAFRRIGRGRGEEINASLPVPFLAHELVRAKLRNRPRSRITGNSTSTSHSAPVQDEWHTLGKVHIGFYVILIVLALASLLSQHRAIATHWAKFSQSLHDKVSKSKEGTETLPKTVSRGNP